jgi:predicted Zn-dependent protease
LPLKVIIRLLLTISVVFLLAPFPAAGKSIQIVPKTPQESQAADLLVEGTRLLEAKKPFKARRVLEQSVQLWMDSAVIHFNLGSAYSECALYDRAIYEFKKALELDPRMTDCLMNLGACYQVQGKIDEAIELFQNYLKKHGHDEHSESLRGMIRALEKHKQEQVDSDPNAPDYLASVLDDGYVQRWPQAKLPLAVYISNGTDESARPVRGFRQEFNSVLYDSLQAWMKASHFKLSFRMVTESGQADIVCTWTDNPAFVERGNKVEQGLAEVLAQSHPGADGTKAIRCANVRILVNKRETGQPLSDEDMKKFCLHEIGHALGIADHSPCYKDVMFWSKSSAVWSSLTKRDKATILRIYQDYPEPPPGNPPAAVPAPSY